MKKGRKALLYIIAIVIAVCVSGMGGSVVYAGELPDDASPSTTAEPAVSYPNGLYKAPDGSLYYYINNVKVINKLQKAGNHTYYFGGNGKAVKDRLVTVGKYKYYFAPNCRMVTNKLVTFGKYKYYLTASGRAAANKLVTIGKYRYYFASNGRMATNKWVTVKHYKYHLAKNGRVDGKKKNLTPNASLGRIVFVGDSRSVGMFTNLERVINGVSHNGITVYAKHGEDFSYLKAQIKKHGLKNFDTLVSWMGANEGGDFSPYKKYYESILASGKQLVLCTVGPTKDSALQ